MIRENKVPEVLALLLVAVADAVVEPLVPVDSVTTDIELDRRHLHGHVALHESVVGPREEIEGEGEGLELRTVFQERVVHLAFFSLVFACFLDEEAETHLDHIVAVGRIEGFEIVFEGQIRLVPHFRANARHFQIERNKGGLF